MSKPTETFEEFRERYDLYRRTNGEYSLSTHIFRTGNSSPISEKLPIFVSVEGIPVIVKSNTDTDVSRN
jgi:hypothetical protein